MPRYRRARRLLVRSGVVAEGGGGATLSGTIVPVGASRTTRLLGTVSGNAIHFGSETAWWNDVINGTPDIGSDFYFNLTLDGTGRAMTGTCSQACGVATATRR